MVEVAIVEGDRCAVAEEDEVEEEDGEWWKWWAIAEVGPSDCPWPCCPVGIGGAARWPTFEAAPSGLCWEAAAAAAIDSYAVSYFRRVKRMKANIKKRKKVYAKVKPSSIESAKYISKLKVILCKKRSLTTESLMSILTNTLKCFPPRLWQLQFLLIWSWTTASGRAVGWAKLFVWRYFFFHILITAPHSHSNNL